MRLRKTVILGMLCISLLGVTACGKDKDAVAVTTESGETNATQEIVQEETMTEEITTEEVPMQSSTEAVSTQAPTEKSTPAPTQKPTPAPATPKPTEAPTQTPTEKPTEKPTPAPTLNPKEHLNTENDYTMYSKGNEYLGMLSLSFKDGGYGEYISSSYATKSYFEKNEDYSYDEDYFVEYDGIKYYSIGGMGNAFTYTLTDEEIIIYIYDCDVVLTMTADGSLVVKSSKMDYYFYVGDVFSLKK